MTKNFFSATLFLIIATSCSKTNDTTSGNTYDSNSINFATQTTKATDNDLDAMEGDADGFVVYGVELNDTSWYEELDGNRYIYDSTTQLWGWASTEAPSWPVPFYQMNFYAYYPASAAGFTLTAVAPSTIIGEIVVEPSILNQTDYLASASGDVMTKPLSGMQPLNFAHITSKISFSVLQIKDVLTVIRQLGIENIINQGSYDYINSTWNRLSNTNIGSFDNYVGSSGPFAKYGVENQVDPIRIDDHYLMLIPQAGGQEDDQTPLWDGSITLDDSGELVPDGAYISIRYRTSINNDSEDLIGYAFRETSPNDSEWRDGSYYHTVYKKDGGSYNGPLYVKAGFKLSADLLNWVAGTEYNYTLLLNQSGGIYLSEYYYDVDGTNTKIRVDGSPSVGDPVYTSDISAGITVDGWSYYNAEI